MINRAGQGTQEAESRKERVLTIRIQAEDRHSDSAQEFEDPIELSIICISSVI